MTAPTSCPTHEIAAVFIVRARVQEGTTAQHLIEYVSAHLENRAPDIHEDIWDELSPLPMRVTARAKEPGHPSLLRAAARAVEADTARTLRGAEAAEAMPNAAESPALAG